MPAPTDLITQQLDRLTGNQETTQLILSIADKIDFHWFEWCFKVGLVALAFLFFKNIIYQLYYYIIMRFDKFVGVGALVKYDGVVGRIKDYDLQNIVIETSDGYIRIPLNIWYKKAWIQLKGIDHSIRQARKSKDDLEVKVYEIGEEIKELKENISVHPNDSDNNSKLGEIKNKLEKIQQPNEDQTSKDKTNKDEFTFDDGSAPKGS